MDHPRILIVEDEAVVARDIRIQLEELGYEVVGETRRAEDALVLAEQLRPSLVLMDIHLAGEMDGIEAAQVLRVRHAIPVVFLTAFAGDPVINRAKLTQPYGYVVKPFDERELRTVIEMALYKHDAERRQRESDEELAAIVRTALDGFWVADCDGRLIEANEAMCRMHGYTHEEMLGRSIADFAVDEEPAATAALVRRMVEAGPARWERRHRCRNGTVIDVEFSTSFRPTSGGRIIAFLRDVTERKRDEAILQVRVRLSEFAASHSLEDLLQKTLDEAEALTGSVIGFFHFVDPDQVTLHLQTWSTNTLARMCTAEGKGQHYPVDKAGVWVDCLRERRPVVHNDYAALAHRKGLPAGHAPIVRELVVPVIREGLVVAIYGVGNKATDYSERDVETLANLAHLSWDIVARKRADVARRLSETHLEALLNVATETIFLLDREGRVLIANEVAARRLGRLREDIVGSCIYDFLPPEIVEFRRARMTEAFTTGKPVRFTDHRLDRWLDQHLVPVRDASGQIASLAVFATDITDSRAATEALRVEQARISQIFNTAPVGIVTTHNRELREMNGVFCSIIGYAREELVGRTTEFLYADRSDFERMGRAIQQELLHQDHASMETRWRRKDGTVIDVLLNGSLLRRDETGYDLVTAVLDITDRKRMEQELGEANLLLRKAQEVARIGSYRCEVATGNWTSSPQLDVIFGIDDSYPRNVASWVGLVAPEQRAEMQDYFIRHVIGGRNRFEREYRIIRPSDGRERWVSGFGELEFDATGNPVRMVGTIQDVTERKELESQLRQAQKMEVVGQLAGGVAHDFNNILTAMTLNLEMMRLLELPTDGLVAVDELEGLAQRAARLTQQLLMFARRQAIQISTVEVNAAMAGLIKMLRRLLGEHITFNFVSASSALWVEADPGMLDQAVMNLCINARDAMPDGGRLTLMADKVVFDAATAGAMPEARPGSFVCLTVSDTGCGMPPAVLEHLFEPFFTTKEIGKGTGLGLASVHGIVHQHHGWIAVESVEGQGTIFRLFLPCSPKGEQAAAAAADEGAMPGGGETILLVEDEPVVRQVTALMLKKLGYEVLVAADGREALRLGEDHAPKIDLVLADMVMPGGMSGLQVGQQLRELQPRLKIVLVSGYSSEIMRAESLAALGVTFLPKPFETRTLAQTLRRCLDGA